MPNTEGYKSTRVAGPPHVLEGTMRAAVEVVVPGLIVETLRALTLEP
jgi:hypothetical protein